MITLKVSRNGTSVCTAGVDRRGAVQALVELVLGEDKSIERQLSPVELRVTGVAGEWDDECQYDWANVPLELGDVIRIEVAEEPGCDPAVETPSAEGERQKKLMQNYVRHLCKDWGWQVTEPQKSAGSETGPVAK